jgi:hypothetical protein
MKINKTQLGKFSADHSIECSSWIDEDRVAEKLAGTCEINYGRKLLLNKKQFD